MAASICAPLCICLIFYGFDRLTLGLLRLAGLRELIELLQLLFQLRVPQLFDRGADRFGRLLDLGPGLLELLLFLLLLLFLPQEPQQVLLRQEEDQRDREEPYSGTIIPMARQADGEMSPHGGPLYGLE